MDANRNGNAVIGVLLLLAGGWFLAQRFFPELGSLIQLDVEWPMLLVGIGALVLLLSVLFRSPGLAVPAAILAGLGGIFYYQNQSGDWGSWSYLWTLIPGFIGVGTLIKNLLEGRFFAGLREGLTAIAFSAAMFVFFSGILGGTDWLSTLWPLILIAVGISILVRNFQEKRANRKPDIIEQ